MANTNLIIALAFAAIFGTALIWLVLYHTHRYIHQQCLELDTWFHLLAQRETITATHDVENQMDRKAQSKNKFPSRKRNRSRGRSERKRSGKRHSSEDNEVHRRMKDVEVDWPGHMRIKENRPMLQMRDAMHTQPCDQHHFASLGWHDQFQTYPQPTIQPYMHLCDGIPNFRVPIPLPGQPILRTPTAMHESVNNQHRYQQPSTGTSSSTPKSSQSGRPKEKLQCSPKRTRQERKVDYIYICDEYPPIALEGTKRIVPT